jgi:hypothetical protein
MNRKMELRRRRGARTAGVLIAGGVIGALAGVGAAYMLLQAREARSQDPDADQPLLSSGNAVKLGLLVFGLFRQIYDIACGG